MKEIWNFYLSAFKNIFNYKSGAKRAELNWFILFMTIFWMILVIFLMTSCIIFAITDKETLIPRFFGVFLGFAGVYFICHALPLISLIKRRFNTITPTKSGTFFGIWASIWFIQFVICTSMFLIAINFQYNTNPLILFPLALIGQACGLVVIITVIFLMIREKPFN